LRLTIEDLPLTPSRAEEVAQKSVLAAPFHERPTKIFAEAMPDGYVRLHKSG